MDLINKLRDNGNRITESRSTICKILESLDLVEHSHQQHGSGIYYLKNQERTAHIVCNSCKKIKDISKNVINSVEKIIAKESNFNLIDNHFVYAGVCNKCK